MVSTCAIPARLDAPAKFLVWDADVGLAFGAGLFTGIVLLDSTIAGALIGAALGFSWSKVKSGRHPAYHWHWLYWHFPRSLRRTPPSFLRETVG